jgi:hypothetical protein
MNSRPQLFLGVSLVFVITLTVCYIFIKGYKAAAFYLNMLAFLQAEEFDGWLLLLNFLFVLALLLTTSYILNSRTQSNNIACEPLSLFSPDGLAIGEENKKRVAFLTELLKDLEPKEGALKKVFRNGELDINSINPSSSIEESKQPEDLVLDPKQRLAEKLRREIKANRKSQPL